MTSHEELLDSNIADLINNVTRLETGCNVNYTLVLPSASRLQSMVDRGGFLEECKPQITYTIYYKISREKLEPEPGFETRTSGFLARRSAT